MQGDESGSDAALVAEALERPPERYAAWAARPAVARALDYFSSESDIRKTGRLDLVTWVQYICGFGYPGPTDDAWASLFAACRVLPMLDASDSLLREHEIAVLLAFAKIRPDNGDTMTNAQLVKHRIKPAVLGRAVARTPGILQHIHVKFENWALGPFTDMFCSFCVSMCGPSSYMPGIDDLPTTEFNIGDSIRQCADAHASDYLKTWMSLVTTILDLDDDAQSPRARRYEQKLHEKRKFMYQHIFIKISEYWFNLTQSRAYVPEDRDTLHYRESPYAKHSADRLLFAQDKPDSELCSFMKRVITSSPVYRALPAWSEFSTHVTICELHKPSRYGLSGLDFLQSDNIKTNLVKLVSQEQCAGFIASKTNVRIGTCNAETLTAEVHGVPLSQMCRALRLQLTVGVLPPKPGSSRPKFRVTAIEKTSWVELEPGEDRCCEREPLSELGMEADEMEDEDAKDRLHQWFVSSGIGKYFAVGAGCKWETFDLSEGMTKHNMQITVPDEILKRVRMQGRVSDQTSHHFLPGMRPRTWRDHMIQARREDSTQGSCSSIDMDVEGGSSGSETFIEPCWIDCHSGAKLTFVAPAGIELYAASPENSIFKNSPYWKWRAP